MLGCSEPRVWVVCLRACSKYVSLLLVCLRADNRVSVVALVRRPFWGGRGGGGKPLGGYRESPSAGASVEVCWPSPDRHCLRDVHDVCFELSGWNVVISDLDCFIALRTQTYRSCSLDV